MSREPCEMSALDRLKCIGYGALYATYKRIKRANRPLDASAESMHPHSGDPLYNESYYFNFVDQAKRIGGYTRIGVLPNQENDIGVIMLYAGGSRLLAAYESGKATLGGDRLEIGALGYHDELPLRRWRITYSGEMAEIPDSRDLRDIDPEKVGRKEVSVDLRFEAVAPAFNFKDADPRSIGRMLVQADTRLVDLRRVSRVSSEHYEQVGRYRGTVRVEGKERDFLGGGHRDHSWGVRDWSAPRLWTWLTCQFGDELAFNLSRVAVGSVDVFNGFLCRGGSNYPVARASLETNFEPDGVTQKNISFSFEDVTGKEIEVTGDVLTVIPLDLRARGHQTLVNEALTEYHWDGRTACGISEYLHQLG